MHKTAGLSEWYKEHERHPVYAAGHSVLNIPKKHSLSLPVVNAIIEQDGNGQLASATPYLIEERDTEAVSA